jgi:hypothetical protein
VLQHQLDHMRDLLQERGVRTGTLDVGEHSDNPAANRESAAKAGAADGREADADADTGAPAVYTRPTAAPAGSSIDITGHLDLHV